MNPFASYLSDQLKEKIRQRRVVVWYDPVGDFAPYVGELQITGGATEADNVALSDISVDGTTAKLARYAGSFFALRRDLEPLVSAPRPQPILIYVNGVQRDKKSSVLMELERAGTCYEPSLKRQARNVMRKFFSDGVIDEMLAAETLTYADIVALLESGGGDDQPGSMLKIIFDGAGDNVALVATWLADPEFDKAIEEKSARQELAKLVESRTSFTFDEEWSLTACREKLAKFLLVNEFRDDLLCDPPIAVSMVPKPPLKEQREFGKAVLDQLRDRNGKAFESSADLIQDELGLATAEISPDSLGRIDTFRFEERVMLMHTAALIIAENYEEADQHVKIHSKSFWARYDLSRRQAQWEIVELLAELGIQLKRVGDSLTKIESGAPASAAKLVECYACPDGWHLLDLTQRRLETRVAQMDDEPDSEEALAVMRSRVEKTLRRMAELFASAFKRDHWSVEGALHQTSVYPQKVKDLPGKVAWFLADSLRFEMGVELNRQLPEVVEAELVPAIATLPSITPLCMSALLPEAASSYSVVADGDSVAGKIGGSVLKDVNGRMKFLKAHVPDATDITLDRLLQQSPAKTSDKIGDARLLVIRSQEIDALGEKNELLARHLMDTVIGNIARAVRKLAKLGFERFVITSDHGHQFGNRKEDDMKIDKPGGSEVEAHRRCWIGKGGQTPPGTIRITAQELGYESDLEFVFPTDLGVFRTGGGLAYHHGGFSLQELVIPVLSFRIPSDEPEVSAGPAVTLADVPETITNRTVGVTVDVETDLVATEPLRLRVALISKGEEAGSAGMSIGGDFNRETGVLTLNPGTSANVAMVLSRDDVDVVKAVVQNADTGAVLCESKPIPIKLKL